MKRPPSAQSLRSSRAEQEQQQQQQQQEHQQQDKPEETKSEQSNPQVPSQRPSPMFKGPKLIPEGAVLPPRKKIDSQQELVSPSSSGPPARAPPKRPPPVKESSWSPMVPRKVTCCRL